MSSLCIGVELPSSQLDINFPLFIIKWITDQCSSRSCVVSVDPLLISRGQLVCLQINPWEFLDQYMYLYYFKTAFSFNVGNRSCVDEKQSFYDSKWRLERLIEFNFA